MNKFPLYGLALCLYLGGFSPLAATLRVEALEADPAHVRSVFENPCVAVSRASFGPHEKMAASFDARDAVIVPLADSGGPTVIHADGHPVLSMPYRTGQAVWAPGVEQIKLENPSDKPMDFVIVELKHCK